MRTFAFRLFLISTLAGCMSREAPPPPATETGAGLFLGGCPRAGRASARRIEDPRQRMEGPDAVGGVGDYLLMNSRAAFIVEGPGRIRSYYYYGGVLIDAVALDGCRQATAERFGELGILAGSLRFDNFAASVLRAFRAESVEIVNDGRDGNAAVVRVHGTDDYFWLLELELLRRAFAAGLDKRLSTPLGLQLHIDYILPPDSPVLTIELHAQNPGPEARDLHAGAALILSDTTTARNFARGGTLSVGGYGVKTNLPWFAAGDGDGAYALAIDQGVLATTNIAGVDALMDMRQLATPLHLGAMGGEDQMRFFVSVGPTDLNSAIAALHSALPAAYPLAPVSGRVFDTASQGALPGADVSVQLPDAQGNWQTFDSLHSDSEGRFHGSIADLGTASGSYQLVGALDGRPLSAPVSLPRTGASDLAVGIDPGATLTYRIDDGHGRLLPAKISIYQGDTRVLFVHARAGVGAIPLAPGDYTVNVTRGFEHAIYESAVRLTPGAAAHVEVSLPRLVDTTGFLSMDGHVHAAPSVDSRVLLPDRIASVAAAGVEVVVGTDHEIITDWSPAVGETGLGDFVATVIGEEVTATVPEHTNMYPVPLASDSGERGGFVHWYGHDLAEIFAAESARGAQIRQLNHPRVGCNYMCLIRWDRVSGEPLLQDPTRLGLPPGAELWSWDFDTVEYMNAMRDVFLDPSRPDETGFFDDWQAFLNLGYRKTAVGVTDEHGFDDIGSPRTYFASSTDEPRKLSEAEMVESLRAGRAVVSAGAFARVTVNGRATLGDLITDTSGGVDLFVHIEAIPEIDVTHFKVFANCDEVLNVPATAPDGIVKFDGTVRVPLSRDAHLTVLGFGKRPFPRGLPQTADVLRVPRVTTNAIYVDADGNGRFDPPGGKACAYTLDPP
jgi:hypothetical protein